MIQRRIYLVGSLGNANIPLIANQFRAAGHECFDDWFSPGPDADVFWKAHETTRGRNYIQALDGLHAWDVFKFDRDNILARDTVVLALPAGRSAHLELGFAVGSGKDTHILLEPKTDRWDIMYRFAKQVWDDIDALKSYLGSVAP